MKIIKRSGTEVVFDIDKIVNAIRAANLEVEESSRLTDRQVVYAAQNVAEACENAGHTVSVEEIQDLVEDEIMRLDCYEVARHYIIYRYVQSLKRQKNTTDDKILSLIECNNEEVKQENSNKNPTVNSVQRDYMAGEISKDLTQRVLLPQEIVDAHNEGLIHFHDSDYFAQHMHNCDLVNLEDMLQNGTVISETLIERPHSFSTALPTPDVGCWGLVHSSWDEGQFDQVAARRAGRHLAAQGDEFAHPGGDVLAPVGDELELPPQVQPGRFDSFQAASAKGLAERQP